MIFRKTDIEGVKVMEPKVFGDKRGYFFECFSQREFDLAAGRHVDFVQDNQAMSASKGVLRGLHFQKGEFAQAKLVRVIKGAVMDVAVDLRKGSPTFGKYVSVILSGKNKLMFFIPRHFAHGYLVLEDNTIFTYKCDNYYAPEAEGGLIWNDPDIAVDWPGTGGDPILSEKDKIWPTLQESVNL
ncbi:MAG: dTDP-4-dehydrorhamnose 3,5-epimerase [Bacteroidales bacterium]|jgi:dTDP-4-dehydrorhamnose 3,5-epimerase|nr:dTDP-4-dehydrorhamnose 3,5-epimerase [Bacteroidales bacterium]MCI2121467.1 dTDP-4-dehydrorhamnose 3,5-epimerase [Bacteroidales bacterium]MCI2145264.1 dTDP-4-dehydrorhamnose 3,5-epimerase [Bacteroidales bacterium]